MSLSPEINAQTEHPTDRVFRELGFEGLGDIERNYKGRSIKLRDYFDQPDVALSAKAMYDVVASGDTSNVEYDVSVEVLTAYCQMFANQAGS